MNTQGATSVELSSVCPFYFVVDRRLELVELGRSVLKLFCGAAPGDPLRRHLVLRRPAVDVEFEALASSQDQVMILEAPATGAVLRGSIRLVRTDALAFIGSPWLTSAAEVERLGLSFADFALHDPALDLLQVLQAHQRANVQLRQLNQRLSEAKTRAEAADRAKRAFFAQISHELRTPMNAVTGLTGILMDDDTLNLDQRDLVQTIRTSGESLLAVINEVLDFSKIESGRWELEDAPYGIRRCAEDCLELVSVEASRKGLDLACWIDPTAPMALRGDGTRVRQILVNLLANAVKFTESGRVVLTGELGPEPSRFRWTVEDSGVGIPEARLSAIFEPFEQADPGVGCRRVGTGLGLAISKRLAEAMGGEIEVRSAVGQGSRFTLSLPAVPATITSGSSLPMASAVGRLAVIVEPRSAHARQLVQLVEQLGATAVLVPRLEECVVRAHAIHADAIVVSVSEERELRELSAMQGLEGVALIACIPPEVRATGSGLCTVRRPVRQAALARAFAEGSARQRAIGARDSSPPRALAGLRVLLAEDNLVNQKVARLQLARLGINPDVVSTGLEAVLAVQRRDYDVVLMDMQMPELDGLEATRRIRALSIRQPIIVTMTAAVFEDEREVCRRAGMEYFVSKPIDTEALSCVFERCVAAGDPSRRVS